MHLQYTSGKGKVGGAGERSRGKICVHVGKRVEGIEMESELPCL